jgi:hypothetical protein
VRAPGPPAGAGDGGGVWIVTGVVLGAIAYAGAVVLLVAGVTTVAPLVVVPPVLVGLIAAGNLLGGRSHGRSPGGAVAEPGPRPSGGRRPR